MIIGNGLIASAFIEKYSNNDNIVIFASGVNNSNEKSPEAYKREKDLLLNTLNNLQKNQSLVYFSTCSIYDETKSDDMYVEHKKDIEISIINNAKNYYIFRLPQLIGKSKNKYTLINFLCEKIKYEQKINIFSKATRNLIDIDDVKVVIIYLIEHTLYHNTILNIANKYNYTLPEIIQCLESVLQTNADTNLLNEGYKYKIDIQKILPIYTLLNIDFDDYLCKKIKKYYA